MDEYYSEQFELPLLLPQPKETSIKKPITSTISLLNEDCLAEVFHHLALEPLIEPPKFGRGGSSPFLCITSPSYQNPDLLSCCLVSKSWHAPALRALYYKFVVRVSEREQWYERVPTLAGGKGRNWVKSLVLVGGGTKKTGGSPVSNLWELFPNLVEVEIFGLGWATGTLLCPEGLQRVAEQGLFTSIRRLEVTATSEYLLSDMPVGKNFLDVQFLLTHLPNLRLLVLRGFNYRLPLSPELDPLTYDLDEILLEKCSLSLTTLRWLLNGSCPTLRQLELPSCSIWDDRESPRIPGELEVEDEIDAMTRRLAVELPLFAMSKPKGLVSPQII